MAATVHILGPNNPTARNVPRLCPYEHSGSRCAIGHHLNDPEGHAASCCANTVGLHTDTGGS